MFNDGRLTSPIRVGLEFAAGRRRSGIAIVNEGDSVADENLRFNDYAFTDEGVTRNLATLADFGPLLNFDKGANFRVVANLAAVEIYKCL